jgi:hypothetical protein
MELKDIAAELRKSYIEIQYDSLAPLSENVEHIASLTTEKVKALEGVVKKFEAVSKKMTEAEAKLKSLCEMAGKIAVNGKAEVKDLYVETTTELGKVNTRREHRELIQIFLNGMNFKSLDEVNKELIQNTKKLKTQAEEYAKQNENWIKNGLEAFNKKKATEAKNTFENHKGGIVTTGLTSPADYDKAINDIKKKM